MAINFNITSTSDFEIALENILDEQFPKGACKERGNALVLYTFAVMFAKDLAKR